MNEQIKKILDDLNDKCKYVEDYGYQYKRLSLEDTDLLLDYITNLQQENQTLQENNQSMQEEMARTWQKCDDLQQENERLKEEIESQSKAQVVLDNQNAELFNYKSRCEKAIELLELKQLRYLNEDNYKLCTLDLQEVKDILQGKDIELDMLKAFNEDLEDDVEMSN